MDSMSLLERTKYLLRQYRFSPKKHLGQNFIIEPSIFRFLADYASIDQDDVVLDIGAGLGFLTRFLANECRCVLAIESDQILVNILHDQLRDISNIQILHGDLLKVQVPPFNKVISAPPYSISSSLLLWLFEREFERAVLIFQREFASRLVASVGDEDYGWLRVVTYYHAEVELLDEVEEYVFYPQPEVKSNIVRLEPRDSPPFRLKNERLFREFVQTLFRQRNRKVRNGVLPYITRKCNMSKREATKLADSLPFHDRRIRELAPEDFGVLANALPR